LSAWPCSTSCCMASSPFSRGGEGSPESRTRSGLRVPGVPSKRRRWPDIGRVHAPDAGISGTAWVPGGPEGQGNSGMERVRVRPINPPVVGSSPTGPTS
jgi:hypothetical protein